MVQGFVTSSRVSLRGLSGDMPSAYIWVIFTYCGSCFPGLLALVVAWFSGLFSAVWWAVKTRRFEVW
jgi:hypothetical protein